MPAAPGTRSPHRDRLLLLSVLVVATCGLIYELITATMASYLLGDSVTQFSLVIGVYLSSMGLGSWLSKAIDRELPRRFVQIQLIIAVFGGLSAPALFLGFAHLEAIRPVLYGILVVVGTMVGLEIPLLIRILKDGASLRDLVARVLAFDYLGALAASILFPLALLPYLGLVRTSLLFGLLNALVALACVRAFRGEIRRPGWLTAQAAIIAVLLGGAATAGGDIEDFGEEQLFDAPVIISQKTPYQRITVTRWRDDIRLYLSGNLQFSSLDEYRYHEALVHPAMATATSRARVLILGGGDGLAVREVLKHEDVQTIDLVDLDPAMTSLFKETRMLAGLSGHALDDPRVTVHNADALSWLAARPSDAAPYDVVLIDLPDPNNFSLGKLYTRSFYRLVSTVLADDGAAVVQSTSPYLAPRSFWCIVKTLQAAGLHTQPFHAHVPSFGDWGFVLVTKSQVAPPVRLPPTLDTRFLNDETLRSLFAFPKDQQPPDVEVNRLADQLLVQYYEQDLVDPIPSLRRG